MIFHCASVSVVWIKVASHLATLNHSATDLAILKRQQTLVHCLDSEDEDQYLRRIMLRSRQPAGALFCCRADLLQPVFAQTWD